MNARLWITLIVVLGATSPLGGLASQNAPVPPAPAPAEAPAQSNDELMSFVRSAASTAPELVRVTSMTAGPGGRELPLVIIGTQISDASPKAIKATGKIRVWVQAGSRDATDAALKLIGEMAAGRHQFWMTSMVVFVSPVDASRGLPPSAGGDQLRLASTDTLAVTKSLVEFDPHVSIEVKTADDPCSAYAVTFSPPLHPNTSEYILGLLRDEWFPFLIRELKSKWSMHAFYRGMVQGGDDGCAPKPVEKVAAAAPSGRRGAPGAPTSPSSSGRGGRSTGRGAPATPPPPAPVEIAWAAPTHDLGVTANYMGTRNRFGIAGVVHARDAASERLTAATRFLEEALGFAWAANARIKKATEDAESQLLVGRSLPTSARPMTIGQVDVLMSTPSPDGTPLRRTESPRPVTMRDQLRFEPASDEVVAAEYFLPASETAVVDLLRQHGIAVRQITQPTKGVEEFVQSDGPLGASSPGLSGSWQASQADVPAGSWVIRMNQPLARLAFALIEPTSDESVATFLRGEDGHPYVIMRRR